MFSLADYDTAFVQKIRAVFPNTRYAFSEWAFKEDAKVTGDTVSLPMISLYRTGYSYERQFFNFAERFIGREMWKDRQNLIGEYARSITVSITYQIDVWGSTRREMDELTAELIMFLELAPTIGVSPSNINPPNPFRFDIVFEDGPIDNTDAMSFETHGRVYRNTIFYMIPEARLISTSYRYLVGSYGITTQLTDGSSIIVDGS